MSNFNMNYNEPDHELQKMVYCQIQELRFEYSLRKPPHIRVGLVANMQEVLSSLTIIYFHILQFRLVYRLWTSVISRFLRALQGLRPNALAGTGDALLMSPQQPCTSPTTHAG